MQKYSTFMSVSSIYSFVFEQKAYMIEQKEDELMDKFLFSHFCNFRGGRHRTSKRYLRRIENLVRTPIEAAPGPSFGSAIGR